MTGLIASHQKPYRQPGDMVTGTTGGVTAGEIHEQLPAHNERSSGNDHADQPVTSKSRIQDVWDGNNNGAYTKYLNMCFGANWHSYTKYFSRLVVVFIVSLCLH